MPLLSDYLFNCLFQALGSRGRAEKNGEREKNRERTKERVSLVSPLSVFLSFTLFFSMRYTNKFLQADFLVTAEGK